jgi:anaerobic ribonucleoside-triphosphate reductase activating protein
VLENKFYQSGPFLNIANIYIGTKALGPGNRAVIWVQGCPFRCPACYSPEWIPQIQANNYSPAELAELITSHGDIDGVTISGGEPMLQSSNLLLLLKELKKLKPHYTFILYTGFKKEYLQRLPADDSRRNLLGELDVLIDGVYIEQLNNNQGLKGSSNQKIWHLSQRLIDFNFETEPRKNEIFIKNGEIHFIGVPDKQAASLPQKVVQAYVGP